MTKSAIQQGWQNPFAVQGPAIKPRRERVERDREWVASHRASRRYRGRYCEACGGHKELEAHHIDGNAKNARPENMQTLCRWCHRFWHNLHRRLRLKMTMPMPRLVKRGR